MHCCKFSTAGNVNHTCKKKLTFCKWVCRPSSPQCFTNPNIALCAKLEGKLTVWLCNSTYFAMKSSGPVTHPTRIPGLRIFDTVSIRITRPSVSSDRNDLHEGNLLGQK